MFTFVYLCIQLNLYAFRVDIFTYTTAKIISIVRLEIKVNNKTTLSGIMYCGALCVRERAVCVGDRFDL